MKKMIFLCTIAALLSTTVHAGVLRCEVGEKLETERKTYALEVQSKPSGIIYYNSHGKLLGHYYIRLWGMVESGDFLHLDLEDLRTGHTSHTRGVDQGFLRLGTRHEWIEIKCQAFST